MSSVGRPREHNEETRAALRAAAEHLIAEGGVEAFSVRAVADEVGTTTRAVYSLFGSKEGLLIDALAQGAFDYLADGIAALDDTDDAVADLVDVGLLVFRPLVLEHPVLYRIAFQRIILGFSAGPELTAARERAWAQLINRVERVAAAGLLGAKPVPEAAVEFNAMMEGLSNAELRGAILRLLPEGQEEATWQQALRSVVNGWTANAKPRSRAASSRSSPHIKPARTGRRR
jgi:AcrR family transcriptional regulator